MAFAQFSTWRRCYMSHVACVCLSVYPCVGTTATAENCAKTSEPIVMPLLTRVGPENRELDSGTYRRHLANTTE